MDSIEDFVNNSTMRAASEPDRNNRVAVYDEAIAIQPHAYLYYNRGNAKLDLKRYEEAIFDYNQALALEANDADAYYNRGLAKAKLQRYEEAIADYDEAIRLQPTEASSYYDKACVFALTNRLEDCFRSLKQAFELDPHWIAHSTTDEDFNQIRQTSEFIEFMKQYTNPN
jgi:tetratricopeptide (TPR) repeat protein